MQRKGPLPGKIFARCILQRRFAGLFGYMARISCQSQLVSDAWRANLATKPPPFPVRGHFRDAWSEKLATDCRPGTHRARILPLPVRPRAHQGAVLPPSNAGGTHFAGILPSASARERIRAQSCHRQTPENASMKNLHNRHLTIVYKALTRNQAEYNKEIGF